MSCSVISRYRRSSINRYKQYVINSLKDMFLNKKVNKAQWSGISLVIAVAIALVSGCKDTAADNGSAVYTVSFETEGGVPAPAPQRVSGGERVGAPAEEPVKEGEMFAGWYTAAGERVDFNSERVNGDMTLYARWWTGPEQFIFINGIDLDFLYARISNHFGKQSGQRIAVGQSFILYCFERPREVMVHNLREHLAQSLEFEIPVLVQLDAITFMDARPDLWNWWDESAPGYDPRNRDNVEWTSWSSADAVKIGWLNWGQQIRLTPMPNLLSPTYRQAVNEQMGEFIAIVNEWYEGLPTNKKWLFAGIKVTGEMAIGVNNWHYPDGNSYVGHPASQDPTYGINVYDFPSRGVQTIGYAALKTGGLKTDGHITGEDIGQLAQRHSELVSKLCFDAGVPRTKIFAHAGGAGHDLEACLNAYASPSWSFYLGDATSPSAFTAALELSARSDAPYFGIAEWSIGGATDAKAWTDPIKEGLALEKCRFLSIYDNVVGSDLFHRSPNPSAVAGIRAAQH